MSEPLAIESPQATVNRARFAGKDFFTLVDDIISRIQLLFVTEFNDFVTSGTGQMLIDIVAWAGENQSFYLDRQASESYLATAKLRKSINKLVRNLGYKMNPAVSASVDIEATLSQVHAFDVPVPIGFQFQGPEGLVFEATEEVIFPAGEGPTSTPRVISAREGVTRTLKFKSDGSKYQAFQIIPSEDRHVAQNTISVLVGGAPWAESVFISYDKTNQYEIDYNTSPPLLRFGDSVAGNVPAAGTDIEITFLETAGAGGLVLSNTIETVVSPLVVTFTTVRMDFTNPLASVGGAPPESLESAKSNAPLFFAARDVAVVRTDYISLSQAYADPVAGAVAVAQAFVALGASDDLTLQELLNNIRAIMNPLTAEIQGYTASAESARQSILSLRDSAEDENNSLGSTLGDIATASTSASVATENAQTEANKIIGDASAATAFIGTFSAGATQIQDPELSTLNSFLSDMSSKANASKGYGDTALNSLGTINTKKLEGDTSQASVAADLTSMSTFITTLGTEISNIETAITTSFETSIETELQAIYDHVDGFLASDCKSNLVQVPILAFDVNGFYSAPSQALMKSLNSYLDARKEVTQSVEVVSGAPYLVQAIITATIGIIDGYVQATVLSNVRKAVEDLLRERAFGDSLRLSDLYTSIQPDPLTGVGGVDGVDYAVFAITGPTDFLNANGNIIIDEKYVVSLGSLALTAETAVD